MLTLSCAAPWTAPIVPATRTTLFLQDHGQFHCLNSSDNLISSHSSSLSLSLQDLCLDYSHPNTLMTHTHLWKILPESRYIAVVAPTGDSVIQLTCGLKGLSTNRFLFAQKQNLCHTDSSRTESSGEHVVRSLPVFVRLPYSFLFHIRSNKTPISRRA